MRWEVTVGVLFRQRPGLFGTGIQCRHISQRFGRITMGSLGRWRWTSVAIPWRTSQLL
jgi:hypothetical protein